MRASIKIGEKIKKEKILGQNGITQTLLDTTDMIEISEKEIISISLDTMKVGKDLKNNLIEKGNSGFNVPMSLVKEEMGFALTVKGRIIPTADSSSVLGVFGNNDSVSGTLPENAAEYQQYGDSLKNKWGFKDLFQGTGITTALKTGENIWKKIDMGKSAENCNKLKKWVLAYKQSTGLKIDKLLEQEEEFKDYRDVKIEIVLSEVQSLIYNIQNMYIDNYSESFDIEKGEGIYSFILKEKYDRGLNEVQLIEEKTNIFGDKVTNNINSMIKGIFNR